MKHLLMRDANGWIEGAWPTTDEVLADLRERQPDLLVVDEDDATIASSFLGRIYDAASGTYGEPCRRPPLPALSPVLPIHNDPEGVSRVLASLELQP